MSMRPITTRSVFSGLMNCIDGLLAINCVFSAATLTASRTRDWIRSVHGDVDYGAVGGDLLCTFRNNHRLIDVYRASHPRDIETTWTSADGSVSCRLDRFYVSAQLKQCVSAGIFPCSLSDHSAVELTLAVKTHQNSKGPSYWKCNTKILDNTDFVSD